MGRRGRVFSLLLVIVIQTAYIFYYFHRDGYVSTGGWLGYPLLLPVGYWTGYQYDKAKYFSEKDILTGLYNRRYILEMYPRYQSRAQRQGKKLFLIVCDCDSFKQINDFHGHAAGDRILRKIGKCIAGYDSLTFASARWGGDEFLITGAVNSYDEAFKLKNEIQASLASIYIRDINIAVSVSAGCALEGEDGESLDELLSVADRRMYEDKRKRECVIEGERV